MQVNNRADNKNKRTLLVVSSLDTGGAQRVVSNMTCGMPDDVEIDILLNYSDKIAYPYKGNIIDLGLGPRKENAGLLYELKIAIRRFMKLRKLKKTGNYSSCISHLESANFLNVITGHKYCKTISVVHCVLSESAKYSSKYKLIVVPLARLLYNFSDKIVCVSSGIKTDLKDNYGIRDDKLIVINNGFDIAGIRALAADAAPLPKQLTEGNPFVIATMGRLSVQKGQWRLIRAFSELVKKHPKARLMILGDGELKGELEQLVNTLGISDKVFLPGFVNKPFGYVAQSDLFVFPSLYEGFPMALIEVMACGLPVVSCDFESGAREILAPDTPDNYHCTDIEMAEYGILTPVGVEGRDYSQPINDAEIKLAEAIEIIINNSEQLNHYKNASATRCEMFDNALIMQKWSEII